ncbi:energy-coupling factor transporter transmembrane protein EcfT [Demequina sp. NBRC 110056]|uniref:energy-coupling factor transporter transmembrane component T family protein n=1 Tax=Demequina sp. NBRC 110056 TaxID=1570345 RepID=UPI0009FC231A|nr:energy-coupling factor transporter transmembrane protein EcfT [Demequina sp. NBRC 110056]
MISMLGLYRPRQTPLHAAPTWFKVLGLIAITVTTVLIEDPVTSVGIMCACVLLLISTEPPAKATLYAMMGTVVVAALSGSLHMWRGDYARAIDIAADLIGVVALALAVTCSTSMAAMLDFVSAAARPIRFLLPPETLGLMFALMLRALPEVARLYLESRMAARARGLDRSIRAVVFPTTTRTVGFALQLGQALHARGIAEEARMSRKDRRAERAEAQQATAQAESSALAARGLAPDASGSSSADARAGAGAAAAAGVTTGSADARATSGAAVGASDATSPAFGDDAKPGSEDGARAADGASTDVDTQSDGQSDSPSHGESEVAAPSRWGRRARRQQRSQQATDHAPAGQVSAPDADGADATASDRDPAAPGAPSSERHDLSRDEAFDILINGGARRDRNA